MKVIPYIATYKESIAKLIHHIVAEEFELVTSLSPSNMEAIDSVYQNGTGNFWIALDEDKVIGTVGLYDIGNNQAVLRRFFVDKAYRGNKYGISKMLLDTLLTWSKHHNIVQIYLGTRPEFLAAQRFYEKHGFKEIQPYALPKSVPIAPTDKKFYLYRI